MNFKKLLFAYLLLFPWVLSATVFSAMRLGSNQGYLDSRMVFSEDLSPLQISDVNRSQAGVFLQVNLVKYFAIQPELNWTRKGMLARVPGYEESWRVDFLELPLLLRFQPLGDKGKVVPSLFAGPYAAARISLSQSVNGQDIGMNLKPLTRQFDLGMIAGISLAVNVDSLRLHFELRYSRGLNNFLKDPVALELPESTKLHTRSLGFLFGYSLPLGKK